MRMYICSHHLQIHPDSLEFLQVDPLEFLKSLLAARFTTENDCTADCLRIFVVFLRLGASCIRQRRSRVAACEFPQRVHQTHARKNILTCVRTYVHTHIHRRCLQIPPVGSLQILKSLLAARRRRTTEHKCTADSARNLPDHEEDSECAEQKCSSGLSPTAASCSESTPRVTTNSAAIAATADPPSCAGNTESSPLDATVIQFCLISTFCAAGAGLSRRLCGVARASRPSMTGLPSRRDLVYLYHGKCEGLVPATSSASASLAWRAHLCRAVRARCAHCSATQHVCLQCAKLKSKRYLYMYIQVYVCICIHIYIFIYVCIFIYVYVYIYIYMCM